MTDNSPLYTLLQQQMQYIYVPLVDTVTLYTVKVYQHFTDSLLINWITDINYTETVSVMGLPVITEGCVDSSVVEHQLRAPWTQVQLPVQEPR